MINPVFEIVGRKIGLDFDPLVIAEIGINHEGSLEVAYEMVDAAIEGSYDKALQAFALNKTIPSAKVAKLILDDMIEANKEYWPELK